MTWLIIYLADSLVLSACFYVFVYYGQQKKKDDTPGWFIIPFVLVGWPFLLFYILLDYSLHGNKND